MPASALLESLLKNNALLDSVSSRLDILKGMYNVPGVEAVDRGFTICGGMNSTTVFQSNECTITLDVFKRAGYQWPKHEHNDSIEHLMVIKGSFSIDIDGYKCVISKSDCITILPRSTHTAIALEDDSQMIGVCIPPERAYILENKCPDTYTKQKTQ